MAAAAAGGDGLPPVGRAREISAEATALIAEIASAVAAGSTSPLSIFQREDMEVTRDLYQIIHTYGKRQAKNELFNPILAKIQTGIVSKVDAIIDTGYYELAAFYLLKLHETITVHVLTHEIEMAKITEEADRRKAAKFLDMGVGAKYRARDTKEKSIWSELRSGQVDLITQRKRVRIHPVFSIENAADILLRIEVDEDRKFVKNQAYKTLRKFTRTFMPNLYFGIPMLVPIAHMLILALEKKRTATEIPGFAVDPQVSVPIYTKALSLRDEIKRKENSIYRKFSGYLDLQPKYLIRYIERFPHKFIDGVAQPLTYRPLSRLFRNGPGEDEWRLRCAKLALAQKCPLYPFVIWYYIQYREKRILDETITAFKQTEFDIIDSRLKVYDFFLVSSLLQACDRLRVYLRMMHGNPDAGTIPEFRALIDAVRELHIGISVDGDVWQVTQDADGNFVSGVTRVMYCTNEEVTNLLRFADGEMRRLYDRISQL